jgi:hypothetical protein
MKSFLICLFFLTFFLLTPTFTLAAGLTPAQQAKQHSFSPLPVANSAALKQPWYKKIWTAIGPGILGSAGVIAGAVIAWYTLRKKNKTFNTYYEQIRMAQKNYQQNVRSDALNKAHINSNFKNELTLIQEEAELNAAQKKLDQEQLTAIINKVQRIIDEIAS